MDRREPPVSGGGTSNEPSTTYRRTRSYSQPVAGPIPGPSHRPSDPLEFFQPSFASSSSLPAFPPLGAEYDEEAFFRTILAMSEDQHNPQPQTQIHQPALPFPQLPPLAPPPAAMPQLPTSQLNNPLLSQTFLAWLQYMQLQMQLQQHQAGQQQQAQQPLHQAPPQPQSHAPFPMNLFALQAGQNVQDIFGSEPLSPLSPLAADQTGGGGTDFGAEVPANTPSPPPGDGGDADPTNTTEEKRRRNTAASARFRVKKKQWTLNLERSITDLSGRVEELEREAAELRRENGWLKEIVMLKSKRFGGQAPAELDAQRGAGVQGSASGAPSHTSDEPPSSSNTPKDQGEGGGHSSTSTSKSAKGKEVQR